MEDVNSLIQAVEGFEEKENPWSDELERFIAHVARTGDILAPWEKVQRVFKNKLRLVMDEFYSTNPYKVGKVNANATNDDFDEMKNRLLQLAEEFDSPPFTIQRLCELLTEPKKNYTKCDKFMRGLEKNLMVVSSWNNTPRRISENNEGMVNGVSIGPSNGFATNDRLKPHWSSLPPSPIATAPPKIPGAPDFTDVATSVPKQEAIAEQNKEEKDGQHSGELKSEDESVTKEPSQTDEGLEKKSNVSATIISSSPPKTINIKRKIDESAEESSLATEKGLADTQVEESPTKKRKSDVPGIPQSQEETEKAAHDSTEQEKTKELLEKNTKSDVATKSQDSPATKSQDSPASSSDAEGTTPNSVGPSHVKNLNSSDSVPHQIKMDTSDEGSSVDPPHDVKSEEDARMDID